MTALNNEGFYDKYSANLIPLEYKHHLELKSVFSSKTKKIGTHRIPNFENYQRFYENAGFFFKNPE